MHWPVGLLGLHRNASSTPIQRDFQVGTGQGKVLLPGQADILDGGPNRPEGLSYSLKVGAKTSPIRGRRAQTSRKMRSAAPFPTEDSLRRNPFFFPGWPGRGPGRPGLGKGSRTPPPA